jgi:hypothetical protein
MKHLFAILSVLFITHLAVAQSNKQVKWSYSTKKISENVYEVHMTATINGNWHMYSQDGGEGPFSTTFTFTKNPLINFDGKVKEVGKMKKVYEEAFKSNVRFYEKTVNFVQTIKLRGNAKTNVSGKVEFMVCNDTTCLPPSEVEFSVSIGG